MNKKDNSAAIIPEDAIAIVGMAFRFPGDLSQEDALWSALMSGQDMVTQIPADRWATTELQHDKRNEAGRSITFSAGVLSGIDQFDADFFGISPREAAMLDPQQRLLLELAWEASENAGMPASSLAGSDCAVYVGISGLDYGTRGLDDLAAMTAHSMTGNTLSLAANRLSYVFDLHGPSLAVDTACSSSLVALHHACVCLQSGQSSMAMVGGVNMLLHPYPFVGFTKASMLSAGGRCKVFDSEGDGYVRAEGGAVFMLKKLSQAVADGDNIQAVILASGVNADGGRKTGITIPSAEGQAELMQRVLGKAGISAEAVDFIEAHGTGTMIGDPIEAHAIGTVYGTPRSQPLPIGSVKANLGHLESASGMAGLVKTVLALKNRALPPAVHLNTPNPNIDFTALNLALLREPYPLPVQADKPLIAGLNSFGFGGANAHVLLQAFPETARPARLKPKQTLTPLVLSAKNETALKAMAGRYADLIEGMTPRRFYDVAYAAKYQRESLNHRLVVADATPKTLARRLQAYAQGLDADQVYIEQALPETGKVAFVYAGNGAQWHGMGCELLETSARFKEVVSEVDRYVQQFAGFSVLEALLAPPEQSRLSDTAVAQPLLFAIQVGVTVLLNEMGLTPFATAGHSVGEVAAAWAAGSLDLQQATRVICARSAAQALTQGSGTMAAVAMPASEVHAILADFDPPLDVEIAGINSPKNVTVSGAVADIDQLGAVIQARGVFFRKLDLDYAFHTRHMAPIQTTLADSLQGLSPVNGTRQYVSSVTGKACQGSTLDAHYWWLNIREPVLFGQAMQTLAELDCRVLIEIGPNAILQRYMNESLAALDIKGRVLPTLKKNATGVAAVREAALRAMVIADGMDWQALFPGHGQPVCLPNYPWQKERHWQNHTTEGLDSIERRRVHPLLGWRVPEAEASWENTLDPVSLPWLADHQVGGVMVYPGAAYLEMALAASRQLFNHEHVAVEEFEIVAPMIFDGEHARTTRLVLQPRDRSFHIQSKQRLAGDEWILHAAGRLLEPGLQALSPTIGTVSDGLVSIDSTTHYALASQLGLNYGPMFQALSVARVTDKQLSGEFQIPAGMATEAYCLHPALLDVCYQSLVDFFQADIEQGRGVTLLPVRTGRFDLLGHAVPASFNARIVRRVGRSVVAEFDILDAQGNCIAVMSGCRFRAAPLNLKNKEAVQQWQVHAVLAPHPLQQQTAFPLPEPGQWLQSMAEDSHAASRQKWFKETLPLLEALTLSAAFEAIVTVLMQYRLTLPDLMKKDIPYLAWLLQLLQQEGLLLYVDGEWRLQTDHPPPAAQEIWQMLFRESAECLPHLLLIGRMAAQLPALITGQQEPSECYRALWGTSLVESLYEADPCYQGINQAMARWLQACQSAVPPGRKLRILEISQYASGLLPQVMSAFDAQQFEYTLALTQSAQASALQMEYQQSLHVRICEFDALAWQLNSGEAGQFDVIVVRHVLHQTQAVQQALAQLKAWLVPGGQLLVAERYPDISADFIACLAPLWWSRQAADEAAEMPAASAAYVSSLYPPAAWQAQLQDAGWREVQAFHETAADALSEGAYLLLARRDAQETLALPEAAVQSWHLLSDSSTATLSAALAATLQTVSGQAVTTDTLAQASLGNALQQVTDHVVIMAGWQADTEQTASLASQLLAIVRQLAALEQPPRLWLLTQGGALLSATESTPYAADPVQSALWGLGRVIMNEYHGLQCKLIDCGDLSEPAADLHTLASLLRDELCAPDEMDEILLDQHGVRRVLQVQAAAASSTPAAPANTANAGDADLRYKLDFYIPGQLRNLLWLPAPARTLEEYEVEVQTRATGLNFRDVMYLMGLLPDEAVEKGFAGASLGLEFSGVVTRVGEGVRDVAPGDAVMGFGASCFASHVVTQESAIARMPEAWDFTAAATVPTVFFTVYYALKQLADLQPGERVLIHGAAGGVGLAAIQLAQHMGAEIFATAGSAEKRLLVQLLGADHVFDSRSLQFADDIMAVTKGEGVDVILNSLAGEAVRRNLTLLKPFGRFLELGKRDFFENTPVGLRPFKDNISYFGIDADQLLISRPQLSARLFREVMSLFQQGVLVPLPARVFAAADVVDAFRHMQQSRHIGKIIVRMDGPAPQLTPPAAGVAPLAFDGDSTWLLTGGITGFGLETVKWLAERGVRHFALLSRSGMQTPGAAEAVQSLQAAGLNVQVHACDVSDVDALSVVLVEIRHSMPPLNGVLHAAARYEDHLIENLGDEHIAAVLSAKLQGAWHLHALTAAVPLQYFITYSSVTTLIGNPGQANYVAANAGLEGLTSHRLALGLPATCIAWGPIADAGYLARNTQVREGLEQRMGKAPISARQALDQLDQLLAAGGGHHIVANFDWRTLSRYLPSSTSQRYAQLAWLLKQDAGLDDNLDIRALIADKSPEQVKEVIASLVTHEVAQILCMSPEKIDAHKPLHDLGLDSLMAVELALGLEKRVGIQLPVMMLNDSPTVDRVAGLIVKKLITDATDSVVEQQAASQTAVMVQQLAMQHGEQATAAEIESLVSDMQTVTDGEEKIA